MQAPRMAKKKKEFSLTSYTKRFVSNKTITAAEEEEEDVLKKEKGGGEGRERERGTKKRKPLKIKLFLLIINLFYWFQIFNVTSNNVIKQRSRL